METTIKGIKDDRLDPNEVSSKLIELEDRSRWNNLRIDGIEETPNETWEYCEIENQELIKNKLKINESRTNLKLMNILKLIVAIDYRKRNIRIVHTQ